MSSTSTPLTSNAVGHIGVVGGGQLAAMLTQVAVARGLRVSVLDPAPHCPAAQAGASQIVGELFDESCLERLLRTVDITTVDLEHVPVEALQRLHAQGHIVLPEPRVLGIIANKLEQKRTLARHGIPTSRFMPLPEPSRRAVRDFGMPAVHKAERGGYDGRGVAILRGEADLEAMLRGPGFIEAYVEHTMELGVMVARNRHGHERVFPVTEMRFNPEGNLLDYLVAPARLPDEVHVLASGLALRAVRALDAVGIFGVEMFLAEDGELLVNEMAPRTHNCGHFTIDACETSQFEQQLRLLLDEPLGATRQRRPAAMVNLLGAPGYSGPTVIDGAAALRDQPDVHVHLYGKLECRPLRKMGHLTALGDSVEAALERAVAARDALTIRGEHSL